MKRKQLITGQDVRAAADRGEAVIRIQQDALITPLAMDAAQQFGVRFEVIAEEGEKETPSGLALAVTRSGFLLKRAVLDILAARKIPVEDIHLLQNNDIEAAVEVVKRVAGEKAAWGIIIDGTGIQSCMIANRFANIRAVNAPETRHAIEARLRYNANVLTLGAEFLTPGRASDIIKAFLDTSWKG